MNLRTILISILMALLIFACQKNDEQELQSAEKTNDHKVIVNEVIQTGSYTYLRVSENSQDHWLAVSKMQVKVGATLYYNTAMEMKNFESKQLKRIFESIYFVQEISHQPLAAAESSPKISAHQSSKPENDISIAPAVDGITVAELYASRNSYEHKIVKIRGQVTKYNSGILGRNWAHLQDGTSDSGNHDITITTLDKVAVGDKVTFEGKIVLNKDFGAGYSYAVIMEEAKLVNEL